MPWDEFTFSASWLWCYCESSMVNTEPNKAIRTRLGLRGGPFSTHTCWTGKDWRKWVSDSYQGWCVAPFPQRVASILWVQLVAPPDSAWRLGEKAERWAHISPKMMDIAQSKSTYLSGQAWVPGKGRAVTSWIQLRHEEHMGTWDHSCPAPMATVILKKYTHNCLDIRESRSCPCPKRSPHEERQSSRRQPSLPRRDIFLPILWVHYHSDGATPSRNVGAGSTKVRIKIVLEIWGEFGSLQ
jgi:hypothetical protein